MPELTLESNGAGGMSAVAELREVHLVELGDEEQPFAFDKELWTMFFIVAKLAIFGRVDVIHRLRELLLKVQVPGQQRGSYPTATPKSTRLSDVAKIVDDKTARGCENISRFLLVFGFVSRFCWHSKRHSMSRTAFASVAM